MSELTVGDPAPGFRVPAVTRQGETQLALADYRGKSSVVLYFYPKDDTPGCTTESCGFRDLLLDFEAAESAVLGISPDDQASHVKFAEKHALPFPLLADTDHAVAEAYGAWKEKNNYGKKYMGIERTTFVIDREGKIAKIYPRVKVEEHVAKVLEFVKGL
ncbi:MAG: thioredoxin-dependent thiol peroxidase [Armatimonadota bacterium]|nr:thioredoxin-dependent thiol peroxidase [Armatimonadota bacterium]